MVSSLTYQCIVHLFIILFVFTVKAHSVGLVISDKVVVKSEPLFIFCVLFCVLTVDEGIISVLCSIYHYCTISLGN